MPYARPCRNSRGNILFLILLAVVLFAALSYAVTAAMRGGEGKSAGSESAELAAAEILQWFNAVDNAVMRMNLVGGIAYEDMSFGYDAKYFNGNPVPNYMNNTRCTSDSCRIFETGGGVTPPDFTKHANPNATGIAPTSIGAGYMILRMMRWPSAGTDLNDVAMWLYYIDEHVCDAVKSGIGQTITPSVSGTAVVANIAANWDNPTAIFTTNFLELYTSDTYVGYAGSGAGRYCNIYHVVIKR